jgi:TetR/AcrR family transcriptional regulator, transcriptional repressor for nem operon
MPSRNAERGRPNARSKLIEAAHVLVKRKGYAATSVDEICAEAGVTKGAFFHHFASKEALGVAATEAWTARADALIFTLPTWTSLPDPLDRLLAHIDFRSSLIDGPAETFTCFVGTLVQETHATNDALRAASDASMQAYAERLAEDIQAAIQKYGIAHGMTAISLAWHVQAALQGGFVLAKARNDPAIARATVAHLKHYVESLFQRERFQ